MLRIEKKSRTKPVNVSIREKGKLLTPTFIQSLLIALGLHISGFTLFNVQPFKIYQTETLYPPVQVNIEMALPESAIYAELNKNQNHSKTLPEPSWSEPEITLQSLPSQNQLLAFSKTTHFPDYPFSKNREQALIPDWIPFSPPEPRPDAALVVNITGPLSDRLILSNLFQKKYELPSKKSDPVFARYSVKVDNRTGKIFWFHAEGAPLKKNTHQKLEKILSDLQFKPLYSGFLTQGEIEICLAIPKNSEGT